MPKPPTLKELTGKHFCTSCLAQIDFAEFSENDSVCKQCSFCRPQLALGGSSAPSASFVPLQMIEKGEIS